MAAKNNTTKPKFKKCKVCKVKFPLFRTTQQVCSTPCALKLVAINADKKDKRAHTKAKKELKDNDRSFQVNKTQTLFNKFIRLRDIGMPCISCARTDEEIDYSGLGGKWDCGHYKTRGAYPELRFDERNAHRQCKKCNGGSGKYSRKERSVKEGYDIGLLERLGKEAFDWLNGPHPPKKYTIDDLKELQEIYKTKIKEIESCAN